ncbi:hypothetical protein AMTR_s00206p00013760 [Amborella trichopoda]|uniref:Uncharacterized protein n=1 Tax=Amborella trichopoda TaxID=13333 RepID=W1P4Y8_AMBTC|nr:hypothetical protein AMTR_s00206p00013760 [Amborella trichopoda]
MMRDPDIADVHLPNSYRLLQAKGNGSAERLVKESGRPNRSPKQRAHEVIILLQLGMLSRARIPTMCADIHNTTLNAGVAIRTKGRRIELGIRLR